MIGGESIMDKEKSSLTAYIDESGSITKTDIEHHKYFIIAILFTRNTSRLKRYFRKGISSLMRSNLKYEKIMENNGEIKGSQVSESKKNAIYERIMRNCKDDFEIGIIVLDNNYTEDNFIIKHARTVNYITQLFLDNSFRKCSKYRNTVTNMHLIVDEQNISTDAEYTLEGYLNQHLTILNPLCEHFFVKYCDSKDQSLIQLIDFISNTFYRNIEKHDPASIKNIKLLKNNLCGGRFFDFSKDHSTKLFLDEVN